MKPTLAEIISNLQNYKDDIDCDIRYMLKDPDPNDKGPGDPIRQSVALAMAIGILDGIGKNSNIPQ